MNKEALERTKARCKKEIKGEPLSKKETIVVPIIVCMFVVFIFWGLS